jgi:alginate O-acetyltransferase complex protein AlgI
MVFASLVFLCIFLPLNLILYFISKNAIYRNVLLVIFSLFFYAWGEPLWITLLIFTTFIDYYNAILVEKFRGTRWAKAPLISSIIFNFGILIAFKYAGFLTDNINAILGTHIKAPGWSLPIGISFYTFQSISYVLDVYRNEVKAQREYYKFLLFVSLFHQLVAGPIVRYVDIASEIDNRSVTLKDISDGFSRFCMGLFKKVFCI